MEGTFLASEGREQRVGSAVLGFCVFGVSRLSVQRSENTCFEGFWRDLGQKSGVPQSGIKTMGF